MIENRPTYINFCEIHFLFSSSVQIPTPDYGEAPFIPPADYDLNNNDDKDNHTPQSFNKTYIRNNMSDAMKEISKDINFRAKQ